MYKLQQLLKARPQFPIVELVLEALQKRDPDTVTKAYVLINQTVSNFKRTHNEHEPLDGLSLIDEDFKRVAREVKLKSEGYQLIGEGVMQKTEQSHKSLTTWPYDYAELSQDTGYPFAILRVTWQRIYTPEFHKA